MRAVSRGVGSSPTVSTKKKLREKLRKLDRKITKCDRYLKSGYAMADQMLKGHHLLYYKTTKAFRIKLDMKRRETRLLLKAF